MSIVINLVSPTASWIMSDGLAIDRKTGEVLSGSLQKFQSLNRLLYIGYTGTYEFAAFAIRLLRSAVDTKHLTVERAVSAILPILQDGRRETTDRAQFLITGKSDSAAMKTAHIDYEGNVRWFLPNASEYRVAILCHDVLEDLDLNTFIDSEFRNGYQGDALIKRSMAAMVKAYSLRDNTVNSTVFFQVIR